jgi:hypothetical protein
MPSPGIGLTLITGPGTEDRTRPRHLDVPEIIDTGRCSSMPPPKPGRFTVTIHPDPDTVTVIDATPAKSSANTPSTPTAATGATNANHPADGHT